jgi:TnpA family transposase
MPRRSIISAPERANLLALPDEQNDLIRHYTFSEADLSLIGQRRGDANRLGFAVQMCLLRYPGQALAADPPITKHFLRWTLLAGLSTLNVRRPGANIYWNCKPTSD